MRFVCALYRCRIGASPRIGKLLSRLPLFCIIIRIIGIASVALSGCPCALLKCCRVSPMHSLILGPSARHCRAVPLSPCACLPRATSFLRANMKRHTSQRSVPPIVLLLTAYQRNQASASSTYLSGMGRCVSPCGRTSRSSAHDFQAISSSDL